MGLADLAQISFMSRLNAPLHQGTPLLPLRPGFGKGQPTSIAQGFGLIGGLTIGRNGVLTRRKHVLLAVDPVAMVPELRSGRLELQIKPLGVRQLVFKTSVNPNRRKSLTRIG